jgi:hypothetical protein
MARRLMQIAFAVSTASLVIGLLVSSVGDHPSFVKLIIAGLAALVFIPIIPAIGACVDFLRLKQWEFAAASIGVLALLAYTLSRLF